MPLSHKTTSSKKVQRGSAKSTSSSHPSSHTSSKSSERERLIDRYVEEERDYKSYAVADYDPHQESARLRHEKQLRDMVEMDYGWVETENC
jgi:hypothetical protein